MQSSHYLADEFSRIFDPVMQGHLLPKDSGKRSRKRKFTMSDSEVITILIMFHLKHFRNLKAFYTGYIQVHGRDHFPHTVSYSRFVELQQMIFRFQAAYRHQRQGICLPGAF